MTFNINSHKYENKALEEFEKIESNLKEFYDKRSEIENKSKSKDEIAYLQNYLNYNNSSNEFVIDKKTVFKNKLNYVEYNNDKMSKYLKIRNKRLLLEIKGLKRSNIESSYLFEKNLFHNIEKDLKKTIGDYQTYKNIRTHYNLKRHQPFSYRWVKVNNNFTVVSPGTRVNTLRFPSKFPKNDFYLSIKLNKNSSSPIVTSLLKNNNKSNNKTENSKLYLIK